MILKVSPSTLSGTVQAPSSKSLSQRFIAAAILANTPSKIIDLSDCNDCTSAISMAAELGAEIELGSNGIQITPTPLGIPSPRTGVLKAGESGLALRMFAPIAALSGNEISIQAKGTLLNRPHTQLIEGLKALGLEVKSNDYKAPITINGTLHGGEIELNGTHGSQFITGLLLALPFADVDSTVKVKRLVSRPYVEMTLELMKSLGLEYYHEHHDNLDMFSIPANQCFEGVEVEIDGDWSSAATLLALGALCGKPELEITGIRGKFSQADSAIKGALLFAGYQLLGTDGGISISKKKPKSFNLDLTNCPDLFPIIAALAAFAKKPSKIKGVRRLTTKESNRGIAIVEEFEKAGVTCTIEGDYLSVKPSKIKPCRINPRGDHRIAMAAAILGSAGAPIEIEDAECVAKSYPAFFDDLAEIGGIITSVSD